MKQNRESFLTARGVSSRKKTMNLLLTSLLLSKTGFAKWAATWQNQQCGCAPSEDSDQSGHPPSLIRVFPVRMKKPWVLSYPLNAQRRLWSDWADAQADLSLRWAHTHFVGFVMSRLIYCKGSRTVSTNIWPGYHIKIQLSRKTKISSDNGSHKSLSIKLRFIFSLRN